MRGLDSFEASLAVILLSEHEFVIPSYEMHLAKLRMTDRGLIRNLRTSARGTHFDLTPEGRELAMLYRAKALP